MRRCVTSRFRRIRLSGSNWLKMTRISMGYGDLMPRGRHALPIAVVGRGLSLCIARARVGSPVRESPLLTSVTAHGLERCVHPNRRSDSDRDRQDDRRHGPTCRVSEEDDLQVELRDNALSINGREDVRDERYGQGDARKTNVHSACSGCLIMLSVPKSSRTRSSPSFADGVLT